MQSIVLFKPDLKMELTFLCSKPFRNGSLQMMAIIHHDNSRMRQTYHYFV